MSRGGEPMEKRNVLNATLPPFVYPVDSMGGA